MALPILSLLILVPLLGILLISLLGNTLNKARWLALVFSTITFALSLLVYIAFSTSWLESYLPKVVENYQFQERYDWIPSLGMAVGVSGTTYLVGVDGISLPLVVLTTLLTTLSIIFSWGKEHRPKAFFSLLLVMELAITGVFIALDFFLFFVFWELVLIPMFFIIGIWGGPNKHYAAFKFLIFTHVGSVVVLLGIFALWLRTGTLSMIEIPSLSKDLGLSIQTPLFIAFLFGFGVKMPMVPFHTWLPDAHVEAPTAGSVILAGLLLKMGGYGLFRVAFGMLPTAALELWWLVAVFGIVSMLYAAFVCLAQVDLKRLIAYSSVSHMGFVLLGASSITTIGIAGGIFQMFNHGLITAVLFMLAGAVKHGTGTRDIPILTGLGNRMPLFSFVLIVGFFASLGLPGLNGFVSEFMVFVGSYEILKKLILIPLLSVVVTGAYYLWTLHKVVLGSFNEALGKVSDLKMEEAIPMGILLALIIFFGLYPTPLVDVIRPPSEQLLTLVRGG